MDRGEFLSRKFLAIAVLLFGVGEAEAGTDAPRTDLLAVESEEVVHADASSRLMGGRPPRLL